MRLVLDTDVIVSAMRSPSGASATLLLSALEGRVSLVANVPLVIKYKATCFHAEHRLALGLTAIEVMAFLEKFAALMESLGFRFLWRPWLRDPAEEMILEAAVNGRHFALSPPSFGIEVLPRAEVLRRLMS